MTTRLIDPTSAGVAAEFVEAPRPDSLAGHRVALLANGKTHGEFLLANIAETLRRDHGIGEVRIWTKPHPSGPPTPQQAGEIRAFATLVVTAIGDCGSCSSCSVFDGMAFERDGIPAAVVISKPFVPTARAIARVNGASQFRTVAIGHPVTSKEEAALLLDAETAAAGVADILLHGHATEPSTAAGERGLDPSIDGPRVEELLGEFREALGNDGTGIETERLGADAVRLRLVTTGAACTDCIMPTAAIASMLESAFRAEFGPSVHVELRDDREAPAD